MHAARYVVAMDVSADVGKGCDEREIGLSPDRPAHAGGDPYRSARALEVTLTSDEVRWLGM
jgi:hypothetical protein